MSSAIVLWMLAVIVGGVVLVFLGLRGKRLNDHPVCRQCRFDLSGCPEGAVTCPECGAGLKRPGSTRIGQRRRRPIVIAVGAAMAGFPLAALALTAFALITGSDVHKYLPLGALLWEARHADAARSKAVATEVLARYTAKKLDEDQIAKAVATALDMQRDVRIPWASEWGDVVETASADGKVVEADQARFRRQAPVVAVKSRPRVRAGDPLPILIELKEARIGSGSALQSTMLLKSVTMEGTALRQASDPRVVFAFPSPGAPNPVLGWIQMFGAANRRGWGGASYGQGKMLLNIPKQTAAGHHSVQVQVCLMTKPQGNAPSFLNVFPKKDDPDQSLADQTLSLTIDPADSPGVELVQPAADQRKKMREVLSVRNAQVFTYGTQTSASASFDIDGRPMEGAYDVIWRSGSNEWKIGNFTTGRSADPYSNDFYFGPGMGTQRTVSGSVSDFDEETVDVILRPSKRAALRTLDVTRIYGEEIVFKDVPVTFEDQSGNARKAKPKAAKQPNLWRSLQKLVGGS